MPILDIPDLVEGHADLQTIKQVARSSELTVVDANGNTIRTLRGALQAIDDDWQGLKEELNSEAAVTAAGVATEAKNAALALGNMSNSFPEGLGYSAATSGPAAYFAVRRGGIGPGGAALARTTCYRRTSPSTAMAFSTLLPGEEYDQRFRTYSSATVLLGICDKWGYPTWTEINRTTGGPTVVGAKLFAREMKIDYYPDVYRSAASVDALARGGIVFQSAPGVLLGVYAKWGYGTYIEINTVDGGPTERAARLISKALGLSTPYARAAQWAAFFAAVIAGRRGRLITIGDSNSFGVGLTKQQALPAMLAKRLERLGVPVIGDGFNSPFPSAVPDSRWTFTGAWQFEPGQTGRNLCAKATAAGCTATYISERPCTEVSLLYYGALGSGATVSVDGGAPVAIVSSGGAAEVRAYTVSGLTLGVHTIQITSTGIFEMAGLSTHGEGLVIDNLGRSGISTSGWLSSDGRQLKDVYNALVGQSPTDVHATVVALGKNDCLRALPPTNNGVALPDFKTNMQAILDYTKPNGPVALLTPAYMSLSPRDPSQPLPAYVAALRDLGALNDVHCIDLAARWVDFATASTATFIGPDGVHFGAPGAIDAARAIQAVIYS